MLVLARALRDSDTAARVSAQSLSFFMVIFVGFCAAMNIRDNGLDRADDRSGNRWWRWRWGQLARATCSGCLVDCKFHGKEAKNHGEQDFRGIHDSAKITGQRHLARTFLGNVGNNSVTFGRHLSL